MNEKFFRAKYKIFFRFDQDYMFAVYLLRFRILSLIGFNSLAHSGK